MSTAEYIPVYPTMAFASRQDHLAWIAANEKAEAEKAANDDLHDDDNSNTELLSRDALKAEKLKVPEIDSITAMLFPEVDLTKYTPAQKLSAIWQHANKSPETFADYQAALSAIRG